MFKEGVKKYFLDGDMNCAETVTILARELLNMDVSDDVISASGAFGGGLGCGKACGAAVGAGFAIGAHYNKGLSSRKHPDTKKKAQQFCEMFYKECGTMECEVLKNEFYKEGTRCAGLVEKTLEMLKQVTEA